MARNEDAQASLEYLIAIGASFFLTLVVFGAIFSVLWNVKENVYCGLQGCEQPSESQQKLLNDRQLNYLAAILVVYFIEFAFILLFLKRFEKSNRPKQKKKAASF